MPSLGDYSKIIKSAINVVKTKPSGFLKQDFDKVHFQRNYMWELILPTFMSGFIPMPGIILSKMCQKVSFGDYTIDGTTDTTRFGALTAKYPGMMDIDSIKVDFLKTVPDLVTTYFTGWRKLMISKSGLYFPKSEYAKTIYIIFLDSTGVPVNRYRFKGVFPLSLPKYDLDYKGEDITKVSIELSVDTIDILY